MASLLLCALVLLPLFSPASAIDSCDNGTTLDIQITDDESISYCDPFPVAKVNDHNASDHATRSLGFICPSLATALNFTSSFPQESICNITIMIPSSMQHFINESVAFSSSVKLIGDNPVSPAKIDCSSSMTCYNTSENGTVNYTIFFNHSTFVEMTNIDITACPCPIGLNTVPFVAIVNTTMTYFHEAALEIFNCERVSISRCNFTSNRGNGLSQVPFRGNTGAVSIGMYDLKAGYDTEITIEVSDTTFFNNSANSTRWSTRSTSRAFLRGILPGRAGGLGVFIYTDYSNVSISVTDCVFHSNYAHSYGGGLYFVFSGNSDCPRIIGTVTRSIFYNNTGGLGAGGFIASVQSRGPIGAPHLLTFEDCNFTQNVGNAGGAVYYYVIYYGGHGNKLIVRNTTFDGNRGKGSSDEFGSALAASIYQEYNSMQNFSVHIVEDCKFSKNVGHNAIVSLGYIPFKFNGTNVFENNTGDALRVIGSNATFGGYMLFMRNNCTQFNCGALSLLSFAQIRLVKNLRVDFVNNTGRFGASIYVDSFNLSAQFQELPYNPHCFLLPDNDDKRPPMNWTEEDNVTMTFFGNKAYFGAVMYVSNLAQCSWVSGEHFDKNNFKNWKIFDYLDGNNNNTGFVNSTDQSHSIVTNAVFIEATDYQNLTVWPGEEVKVNVSTVDELGGPTGSIIRMKFTSLYNSTEQVDQDDVKISPNTFVEVRDPFQTKFRVFLRNDTTHDQWLPYYDGFTGNISLEHISSTIAQEMKVTEYSISVNVTQCPGGYNLTSVDSSPAQLLCLCEAQREIIQCQGESIIIQAGQWATRVFSDNQPSLSFFPCPSGYCKCLDYSSIGNKCVSNYSNNDPNSQCSHGRTGILCGNCRANMSVTAVLNQCSSNCKVTLTWPWFIVIGVLDAIIITIIIVLDKPLPQWSYPMLFYVQISPLLVLYFSEAFWFGGKYLYFPASLIGLYVPYDFCLHNDIRGIAPHLLRFIPFITAIIVCPIIVLIKSYFDTALVRRRLWQSRLNLHGVWTIIVLLYPTVILNAVRGLHCRHIPDSTSGSYRWFSDGSVKCFAGNHLILLFFGCLILLLNFIFIFSMIGLKLKRRECSQRWVVRFLQSVAYPYSRNNYLWGVADLVFKFGLIGLVEIFPQKQVQSIMFLSLIICISSFCNPYKKMFFNYFQVAVYSIILILLMLDASNTLNIAFLPKITTNSSIANIDSKINNHGTIILLVLYYLPLLMSLFVICLVVISICVVHLCLPFRQRILDQARGRRAGPWYADDFSCQNLNPNQLNTVDVTEVSVCVN